VQHDSTARDAQYSAVLPAAVAAAREAYVRGDFCSVVATLGESPLGSKAPAEARLLRARALLKLQRSLDVLDELPPSDHAGIGDKDERAAARMLHAAATARVDLPRGLSLLAETSRAAAQERAHSAVRAEIAYFRAVAHWSDGNLSDASRYAIDAERCGKDVLAVRATQLRAFIAASTPGPTRYADALALFRTAARGYTRCRERDVDLATIIVEQVATLEHVTRSANSPGSHTAARGRRALPGSFFGTVVPSATRLRLCCNDAWLFALDGDDVSAFRIMREAEENAPSDAWHVWTLAVRAAIAVVCGERAGARTFADDAIERAVTVAWSSTNDEERIAFLQLAETYAYLDDANAAAASLARFDGFTNAMDNTRVLRDRERDPRLAGWIAHVRGLVQRGFGDHGAAGASFSAAVDAFASCGYLWRETLSLIELDATQGRGAAGAHLDRAVALVREHFPHSFLVRRLGPWMRGAVDPVIATLSPAEREVLRHVLDGRSQREIADVTGRAYNTVRTQMQALHRKLGTSSEHQIVAACAQRGVGSPSWSFEARAEDGFARRTAATR
jgi:DNA-binding CsgD family transcriptional regulator